MSPCGFGSKFLRSSLPVIRGSKKCWHQEGYLLINIHSTTKKSNLSTSASKENGCNYLIDFSLIIVSDRHATMLDAQTYNELYLFCHPNGKTEAI